VVFEADGDGAIARFARVSLDPEFYSANLDEARKALLLELEHYASDEAHEPCEPSFVTVLKEAAQPNYLGSPQVVAELLQPLVWRSLCKALARHFSGLDVIPGYVKTGFSDMLAINQRITAVLCGEDEAFHGLEAWRTEKGLGQAIIHQLGLDAGWYADENLTCIVSEGLAGVSTQIAQIVDAWAKEEPPPDLKGLFHLTSVLQQFAISVVMGTHTVLFPGVTLNDFTWENRMRFASPDDTGAQEIQEEEVLVPGPPVHPRPDDKGKPVKLTAPSTPTALWTWQDAASTAVVIPDGPMPTELAGIGFDSWRDAPTDNAGWERLAARNPVDEPPFSPPAGKKAAAGVVVMERDGRVWIVAPSNAFVNYPATFPKGTRDAGMSLQATALREAFEEAGLRVELTGFLVDVARSTSHTRYYLARRVGGNPADMGWESQAVMLIPASELAARLTNKNDAPIIQAIKALA
jgi:8-oxo-dGTP pyrophosphatase MutT (NUDIX family)